jgi:hypothetical protein
MQTLQSRNEDCLCRFTRGNHHPIYTVFSVWD